MHISLASPSYVRINLGETCYQPLFQEIFQHLYKQNENYNQFEYMTKARSDLVLTAEDLCKEYVQKYISIVSVEAPTSVVLKSTREQRNTFSDKLAVIGGTLGLFSGMSILSMVEILCFCIRVARAPCNGRKTRENSITP